MAVSQRLFICTKPSLTFGDNWIKWQALRQIVRKAKLSALKISSLAIILIATLTSPLMAGPCNFEAFARKETSQKEDTIHISFDHYWPANRPVRLYADPTSPAFSVYKKAIQGFAPQINRKFYFGDLEVASDIYFVLIDVDKPVPDAAVRALALFSDDDENKAAEITKAMSDRKPEIRVWWKAPKSIDLMRLQSKTVKIFPSRLVVFKTRTEAISLKAFGQAILLSFIGFDDLGIARKCENYRGLLSGAVPPAVQIEDDVALLRSLYGVKE